MEEEVSQVAADFVKQISGSYHPAEGSVQKQKVKVMRCSFIMSLLKTRRLSLKQRDFWDWDIMYDPADLTRCASGLSFGTAYILIACTPYRSDYMIIDQLSQKQKGKVKRCSFYNVVIKNEKAVRSEGVISGTGTEIK